MAEDIIILWREDDWRCEFHPRRRGQPCLDVYLADRLVTSESTDTGESAIMRAEVFRQRVRRGHLRAD